LFFFGYEDRVDAFSFSPSSSISGPSEAHPQQWLDGWIDVPGYFNEQLVVSY
jgi:hypothetical protein